MTTNDLIQAYASHANEFGGIPLDEAEARARRVIARAKAEAWDEGFEAGESNGYAIGRDLDYWDNEPRNPYRKDAP